MDRCIVLVMHTTSYGAAGFSEACRRAGARVMIASDRCHVLDRAWHWPGDSLVVDFSDPEGAAAAIATAARASASPVRAVLPVGGELPAQVAAAAARRLGLAANGPGAMTAAGNKLELRRRIAAGGAEPELRQPRFLAVPRALDPAEVSARILAPDGVGFPCVIKPLMLSGSRGVIRADDPAALAAALARLARLLSEPAIERIDPEAARSILIESFVAGSEVALEGLLTDGKLEVLALFDKPDPLDGPFFEETLYVTPSRLPLDLQRRIEQTVAAAARVLGLSTGPIHAELRLTPAAVDRVGTDGLCPSGPVAGGFGNPPRVPILIDRVGTDGLCPSGPVAGGFGNPPRVPILIDRVGRDGLCPSGPVAGGFGNPPRVPILIDLAARPIGGLCARSLRFEGDLTLEDVVVQHALGGSARPARERRPSGVMMIPIPTAVPAALRAVHGLDDARAVPGVSEVVISVRVGETVVPLPEGASYLGFVFASGDDAAGVESALREAGARLAFTFAPLMPTVASVA